MHMVPAPDAAFGRNTPATPHLMRNFPSCRKGAALTVAAAALAVLSPVTAPAQLYTGPYGAGGTWNLYQVVTTPASWTAARAAAKAKTAASTGLPGVTSSLTGHLAQISSEDENSFIAAAAALTPGSGNSNVWLGANDLDAPDGPGELGTSRTGWQWADSGTQIHDGDFAGWAPGEPNNAGGVEDGVEMRTDGAWNDISTSGTRKYVIEWDLQAAAPIAGAAQFPIYYTGPYGPGGTWNLYRVVMRGETWDAARQAARAATAKSTGLAGVSGPAYAQLKGHLISLSTEAEHHFAYQVMAFGSLNTAGFWTGATDRRADGGDGLGTDPLTGWRWTDEPVIASTVTFHRFPRRPFFAAEEPSNTGGVEDVVEVTGTGLWNDATSVGTLRRFLVEWNTAQPSPVAGAAQLEPMLTGTRTFGGAVSTSQWNVKGTVFTSQPSATLTNLTAALRFVNTPPPTANTREVTTPVLNNTDSNPATNTAGRSTNGLFWPKQPLANDTANVDDNYYLVNARTRISCAAGTTYTVNVHSDDGFYLRITGTDGRKATFTKAGGLGGIDASDASAIYFAFGTGDSSTRGVFTVSETGEYDVEYVGFDITGGSFQEVSWAPVEALNDWDTGEWKLMGGTPAGSPQLPPAGTLPGLVGTGRKWGIRSAAAATAITGIPDAVAAVQNAAAFVDSELPVINFNDAQSPGSRFRFAGDFDLPGGTAGDDNQFAVVAKATFEVPAPGTYTICVRADDNFALRVAGAKWAGRTANYNSAGPAALSNGFIDSLDASTLFWLPSADAGARAVINFSSAGTWPMELVWYEGTGGAGAEIYYAPGICVSDLDSTDWKLIGDPAAYTATLPATLPGATAGSEGAWGLRVLESGASVPVTSVGTAVNALLEGSGVNHRESVPVLNHIAPSSPGTGGIFGGDLALPGIDANNNANLAIHARGRVIIPATGLYTFIVRSGDGWALRFKNASWLERTGAGIDPADPSTLVYNVTGSPTAVNDFRGGGVLSLNQGAYDVDFVTFQDQRDTQFELYAAAGNVLSAGDTAALGTAGLGDAGPGTAWRLVGHKADGGIPRLGVLGSWSVRQTKPQAEAYAGSGTIAGALAWLGQPAAVNGATTSSSGMINFSDPGFGGPGSIVNDVAIPQNNPGTTAADDNYYATEITGTLRVPADGIYSIGWQGDDGGFLEFISAPTPVSFSRLVANATGNTVITTASDGGPLARLQHDAGGANTRSIGDVLLFSGQYPVRAVWFEGSGSSYFELFAAAAGQQYNLITSSSYGTPVDTDGLQLGDMSIPIEPLEILSISFPASRMLTLTWASNPGKTYVVERSADLSAWATAAVSLPSGGTITSWTTSAPIPAAETRWFYRVREM